MQIKHGLKDKIGNLIKVLEILHDRGIQIEKTKGRYATRGGKPPLDSPKGKEVKNQRITFSCSS